MTIEQVKAYIPDLVDQFSNILKNVYAQGGRSFWVHNTGPLGCLPYVLDRFLITAAQVDKFGCAMPFNEVSQFYNHLLMEAVKDLREELPRVSITYVDIYSLKRKLITQAKKFGLQQPLVACCGHGGKYNYNRFRKCGATVTVKGREVLIAKSCKDPSVRVNWDGAHYTEAANKWVFEQIVNGSYTNPPIPLNMACNRIEH